MQVSVSLQGMVDPVYAAVADRVRWAGQALAGRVDGVEIGCYSRALPAVAEALEEDDVRAVLRGFGANTLHVVEHPDSPLDEGTASAVVALANRAFQAELVGALSVHLDMGRWFDRFEAEADPGLTLAFENLDASARLGRTLADVADTLAARPRWGLVLDVAHALEMEAEGEPPPETYAERFRDRTAYVHFSWAGNLYPATLVGADFNTRHSLASLAPERTARLFALIRAFPPPQVVIEGVIPPGPAGFDLLVREIAALRSCSPPSTRAVAGESDAV